MKTMTLFEARHNFSRTIDAAREDVVIVTRNGKPVAAIQGIDDADMEDLLRGSGSVHPREKWLTDRRALANKRMQPACANSRAHTAARGASRVASWGSHCEPDPFLRSAANSSCMALMRGASACILACDSSIVRLARVGVFSANARPAGLS